jgi:SAM-dependent methyltransferase
MSREPSAAYADTRLTALYDALNPPGDDTAFYLSLAGPPPRAILDVGCGTGLLACALAARGHQVTGADPAPAMLAVARARPGGDQVRWIETDAAGLSGPTRFDLIIMTGHVFQLLLDDGDVRAALGTLRRRLAPGGRIAFETRNPGAREWQYWSPRETRRRLDTPAGPADVHYDISTVAGDLVTYETCVRFPDGEHVVVPDTLRFMSQAELAGFLAEAGLTADHWYGDWDRSPVTPASPEIITVARAH